MEMMGKLWGKGAEGFLQVDLCEAHVDLGVNLL